MKQLRNFLFQHKCTILNVFLCIFCAYVLRENQKAEFFFSSSSDLTAVLIPFVDYFLSTRILEKNILISFGCVVFEGFLWMYAEYDGDYRETHPSFACG